MLINKEHGFSLIELLIGIAVGLIILTGILHFIQSISASSTKTLKTVQAEYQIQSALSLMANDIRRAGYWANAQSMISSGANTNPFMVTGATDLTTPSNSCILFTYDYDKNGSIPVLGAINSDERFGYRLSGGAIQTRASTDSTFNCNAGSWENLTDPNIVTVTALTFTLSTTTLALTSPATTESLILRYVTISVVGQLKADTSIVTTLSTNIKVRNDKYQP